jgi:quercetin dioxygenase-like cupin family protein
MPEIAVADWSGAATPHALAGDYATMRQIIVPAGHVAARHSHPHEQFLYVVSGNARLLCDSGVIALTAGTALRLAPHAWHGAEFSADTVLLEFNVKEELLF